MAIADYAKLKKTVAKTRSENVATWKDIQKTVKESQKRLESIEGFLSDSATSIQLNARMAGTKLDDWVRVADRIIAKQTELKTAAKRKDKAAVKDLEAEIRDLDALATAHRSAFSKTIEETNALKAAIRERHEQIGAVTV